MLAFQLKQPNRFQCKTTAIIYTQYIGYLARVLKHGITLEECMLRDRGNLTTQMSWNHLNETNKFYD